MSLGFLTESALVPSKATPIRVDSQSLVDLKAVVFQKDQERQQRLREAAALEPDVGGRRLGKYAHLRGKSRKRGHSAALSKEEDRVGKRASNRGVEKRSRRDQEAEQLDLDDRDDDAKWERKSKAMLEKKAKLYEQMMNGRAGVPAASECLVDFESKRLETAPEQQRKSDSAERVEIVDEFGRTRLVANGSPEHLEYLSALQEKNVAGGDPSGSFQRDESRGVVPQYECEENLRTSGGGSFVVSQWEHRLKAEEKSYLHEVHERAALAKAAAQTSGVTRMSKKQLRLEKLRQERMKAEAARESASNPIPPLTSQGEIPSSKGLSGTAAPTTDAAATAQATHFLNELSSLM